MYHSTQAGSWPSMVTPAPYQPLSHPTSAAPSRRTGLLVAQAGERGAARPRAAASDAVRLGRRLRIRALLVGLVRRPAWPAGHWSKLVHVASKSLINVRIAPLTQSTAQSPDGFPNNFNAPARRSSRPGPVGTRPPLPAAPRCGRTARTCGRRTVITRIGSPGLSSSAANIVDFETLFTFARNVLKMCPRNSRGCICGRRAGRRKPQPPWDTGRGGVAMRAGRPRGGCRVGGGAAHRLDPPKRGPHALRRC